MEKSTPIRLNILKNNTGGVQVIITSGNGYFINPKDIHFSSIIPNHCITMRDNSKDRKAYINAEDLEFDYILTYDGKKVRAYYGDVVFGDGVKPIPILEYEPKYNDIFISLPQPIIPDK